MSQLDPGGFEREAERYISGVLSPADTLAFEHALADPQRGEVFREILLIRELLRMAPPHGVPDGLNERIALAVEAEMGGAPFAREDAGSAIARQIRIAREGASWIFRGPAMALAGLPRQQPAQAPPGGRRAAAWLKARGGWLLRRVGSWL